MITGMMISLLAWADSESNSGARAAGRGESDDTQCYYVTGRLISHGEEHDPP